MFKHASNSCQVKISVSVNVHSFVFKTLNPNTLKKWHHCKTKYI